MNDLIQIEDTLGEAGRFLHALYMAASGLSFSRETDAFQTVIVEIEDRLKNARDALKDLRKKPLANSTIDLKALEKAVKAEIARRKSLKGEVKANG